MKSISVFFLLMVCFLTVAFNIEARSKNKNANRNSEATRILIVGLEDNVKSNYFYNQLIAEETGMKADLIDAEYNSIISENIASGCRNSDYAFIPASANIIDGRILNEIKVLGESDESYSDISSLCGEELKAALEKANADYLLVLNQHYLKWEERPLRTLFHIVSYSLYDKNKNQIHNGNNFFTSMSLENPDRIRKISRKSTSKIASAVIKSIDDK
jgi:hypothetical protein